MKRRFPLHVHISTLFLTLILIVGGVIGGLGYKISHNILETTASDLSARISRETLSEFTNIIGPAEMATRLLSFDGITQAKSLDERLANLGFMREALNNSEALTSIYVGYGNGDFFMVRRIRSESGRKFFNAPEGTAFIVQSIDHTGDTPRGRFIYLDARLATLRSDDRPDYATAFDPRTRDWYKAALTAGGQIKTPPYLFFTTQRVGTTIANRAARSEAVVGADINLETLDQSLARQKVTPGTEVVLANQAGQTLAYEDAGKSVRLPETPDGKPVLANISELGAPVLAQLLPVLQTMDGYGRARIVTDGRRRGLACGDPPGQARRHAPAVPDHRDSRSRTDGRRPCADAAFADRHGPRHPAGDPHHLVAGARHFRTLAPAGARGGSDSPLRVLAADQGRLAGARSQ